MKKTRGIVPPTLRLSPQKFFEVLPPLQRRDFKISSFGLLPSPRVRWPAQTQPWPLVRFLGQRNGLLRVCIQPGRLCLCARSFRNVYEG